VKFFIGRVAFDQLGKERAAALNAVETSFHLPPAEVELTIAAGHDALLRNNAFRAFLESLGPAPAPTGAPAEPAGSSGLGAQRTQAAAR